MQKKRKICIITGSRADWGLLHNLAGKIKADFSLTLQLVVCGMHLEKKFGFTYRQILKEDFKIDARVKMDLANDLDSQIAIACANAQAKFAKIFTKLKPDIIVVLGDRFEALAAACAGLLCRIPLAHLHGGEVTLGAYDDAIRHAVTKLSFLHFTSHSVYRQRIIRMGEHPSRVFTVGAPGIDDLHKVKLLTLAQANKELGVKLEQKTALVTFHPVTWQKNSAQAQIKELISALDASKLNLIFTMPNADPENQVISQTIKKYVQKNRQRAKFFVSLGKERYFSLMKYSAVMVGNSSSGILEAASFKLPVVNIGLRQAGRVKPSNVIDAECLKASIAQALNKAVSPAFVKKMRRLKNPFDLGQTSVRIKNILKTADISDLAKGFYDFV